MQIGGRESPMHQLINAPDMFTHEASLALFLLLSRLFPVREWRTRGLFRRDSGATRMLQRLTISLARERGRYHSISIRFQR